MHPEPIYNTNSPENNRRGDGIAGVVRRAFLKQQILAPSKRDRCRICKRRKQVPDYGMENSSPGLS